MRPILLLTLFLASLNFAKAQVKTNFNNAEVITAKGKFDKNYLTKSPHTIPAKDIKALLERESLENKSGEPKPFKIAEAVKVDIDVVKEAAWVEEVGFAHGKYTIVASGAKSISANFDRFKLPRGSELYVYSANGEMITGPVTENENNENNFWGTWVYKGEALTVDFKTPIESKSEIKLHISSIAYGYKELYVNNFGESAACNINVLCIQGNGWENERNSVALILDANSIALCTGALINNTCNFNTLNFLTANHCFDGNPANWKFTFQAWSSTCNPSQNANGVTLNGSTLRARNAASDFCLVELNQMPPANSNITFAGWNRNPAAALNTVGIHHPAGDVMKIAIDANPPVAVAWFTGATNHWRAHFQQGTVQPGSSGSPLFDQNHRIIGQLHGDQNNQGNYCTQQIGEYGRFDVSWVGGGTNDTRLSNWLDPNNTGALTTDTRGNEITGPALVCTTANYTFDGQVTWSSSNPNGLNINSTTGAATRVNKFNGQVTITATINSGCGGVNVDRTIWVGKPSGVITNPSGVPAVEANIGNWVVLWATSTPGATTSSLNWWTNNAAALNLNVGYGNCSVECLQAGYNFIYVTSSNACGTSLVRQIPISVTSGGCQNPPCNPMFVSPNPSSSYFEVSLDLTREEYTKGYDVKLYDSNQMNLVYQTTSTEPIIRIETLSLKKGMYILQMTTYKQVITDRVLIE